MSFKNTSMKKSRITEYANLSNKSLGIQKLNNDCLRQIFTYLPISDKVKIERVCLRWQEVAESSWTSVKRLDLSEEIWGRNIFGPAQMVTEENHHIIQKVLTKYGYYLNSIKLSFDEDFDHKNLNKNNIISLGKLCPNLISIKLIAPNPVQNFLIKNISRYCKSLMELKVKNIMGDGANYFPINKCLNLLFLSNSLKVLELKNTELTDKEKLNLPHSLEILRLTNIYFSTVEYSHKYFTNKICDLKNLRGLQINFDDMFESSLNFKNLLKAILQISHNITELNLEVNSTESFENEFSQIFLKSKLRILKLKNCTITGKCLLNLKEEFLESLTLSGCRCLETPFLKCVLQNFKNLHTLKLKDTSISMPFIIQCLKLSSFYNKKLHNLKISRSVSLLNFLNKNRDEKDHLLAFSDLNYFTNFKHLQTLKIHKSFITDDFLINISQSMQELKNLDISSADISDKGLKAICKLTKLKHLSVNDIKKITGKGFELMPNLLSLNCSACNSINNKYLYKIVLKCPKLLFLDFGDCINITTNFLILINKKLREMSKDKILAINCYNSRADKQEIDIELLKNLHFVSYEYYLCDCRNKPYKFLQPIE